MKKHILYVFVILIAALLVGCTTNPSRQDPTPTTIITKIQTVVVKVPQELLVRCTPTAPPHRQAYATSDATMREELLVSYVRELLTIIKNCDKTITTIDKWSSDQEKLFTEIEK
jgi:hypothetical protein